MMLPSALHRISQLCLTEELRCQLVSETGIGEVHLPSVQPGLLPRNVALVESLLMDEDSTFT
ncbi:hypothetical protein J6590_023339 [Homalodisca vitripennis]|nr:hypothetical protein J6590_023339 [Homalodisca vitripennis]